MWWAGAGNKRRRRTHAFGGSRILVGPSAQARRSASGSPPAAASGGVSTEERLPPSSCSFFPLSSRETQPFDFASPGGPCSRSFNLNQFLLIGRFLKTKPHPFTQDSLFIGVTSCHPAFLSVNWLYPNPAPFAISDPIRANSCPSPTPAFFLLVNRTVIILMSKDWVVAC